MSALTTAAWLKDFETFRQQFDATPTLPRADLAGVMAKACANKSLPDRLQIVHFLLDQGAPVDVRVAGANTALHVMLSARQHDMPAEAALIPLFVEHGADLNATNARHETPLLCLTGQRNVPDADIQPIVDAFLAEPSFDPFVEPYAGSSVIDLIRRVRPGLAQWLGQTTKGRTRHAAGAS